MVVLIQPCLEGSEISDSIATPTHWKLSTTARNKTVPFESKECLESAADIAKETKESFSIEAFSQS
jgi:hypothetical protein